MRNPPRNEVDYLLVDISNSYTKLAFATERRVGRPRQLPTEHFTRAAIRQVLGEREVGAVVVSSVVPKRNAAIRKAAGRAPILFINAKCKLGIGIDYPAPHTIGADRLANAAAVTQLYGYPAIAIDFGTAATFDVVSGAGDYVGGVIAPGLEAMTSFVHDRTALLPKLTLREPASAIGRTTRAAMMSGAIYGYRGLVREIVARIRREAFPKGKLHVVATGGYARLLARQLPEIQVVNPTLTLEGLRLIANLNLRD